MNEDYGYKWWNRQVAVQWFPKVTEKISLSKSKILDLVYTPIYETLMGVNINSLNIPNDLWT